MNEPMKPVGFEDVLGPYETLYWDSTCKEPILWGWRIVQRLGEERFAGLQAVAKVECLGRAPGVAEGVWVVVARQLTVADAIAKYGAVSATVSGPRGGWKSTTYGVGPYARTFTSRRMAPA